MRTPSRSVTPFRPGRRSPGNTSTSFIGREISAGTFATMLELEPDRRRSSSALGLSLYDLSLKLRDLNDVIDQIKNFKKYAPLAYYRYACVIELIYAAQKCPPDAKFRLLTIAAKMVRLDNFAERKELKELLSICNSLINEKAYFVTFGENQEKPRRKLEEMAALFRDALKNMRSPGPRIRKWGTEEMEMIVQEQLRRSQSGEQLLNPAQAREFLVERYSAMLPRSSISFKRMWEIIMFYFSIMRCQISQEGRR